MTLGYESEAIEADRHPCFKILGFNTDETLNKYKKHTFTAVLENN